ncbi:ATP binding microtubule motor family protein, putative isoform 1 [Hibiscus syriacus]|uniref:ATP binding microtubule motor family protein, putative isoform 1 n=1 Tax=Hibiscus syriacus TaxID=106335 RepID=A0A6A3BKF3_HIBSY|nr:ATP binding microtubule motor family protein, putative isoform 1 [Hibiscus syriacus]
MTLEDFFTLTEMKDGLTVPSRVEELVTVMKEEKECVVKNVSDVTRQWTSVASTIAATENKDCLDLFIQLDGLLFLDRWLKDAQEFGNDSSDSFVEESINALLRALEKLHRNREMSVSSEIWTLVKNLLGHNSSRVQESARLLFESWKQGRVTDHVDCSGREYEILGTATVTGENNGRQCSAKDGSVSRGSSHEENDGADAAKIQENSPKKEELPAKPVEETASHEACSLPDSKQEDIEVLDAQKLNGLSNDEKLFDVTASNSSTVEHAGVGSALEITTEPNSQNDSEANRIYVLKSVNLADEKTHGSEPKKAVGDLEVMNHSENSSQLFKIAGKDIESHLSMLRSSSEYQLMYKKPGNLESRFSRKSDIGIANEDKENIGFENLRGGSRFTGTPVVINSTSDIELEYGIVDALEVARIVAQEVEREVVDDRELSSSSSEKISEGGIREPNALGSINGKQDLPSKALPKEVSTGPTQSAGVQTEGGELINSDDADNEPKNKLHDMESSQVTVAQDPEPNTEKGLYDFDLNQEVCSDDMERAATSISTPVSVVSASRAAAVRCLPAAPLQFEGALRWKGSAATSAFRPASPRRNCDGDKTLSLGGTSNSAKQRLDCLDFDLNVAGALNEQGAELMSGKQVAVSPGLHSAEPSEENHRKSERFELDLNCISDDGDAPALDSRVEQQLFYDRNGHCSQSPVSSSSPMQSSLRNFDLNDRPYSQNNALELGPYPGRSSRNALAHGGPKPNDPVISIMGARVEVNRNDFLSQIVSFPNGKALEPATDGSISRTAGFMGLVPTASYTHSPAFSANGLPLAPKMPFSSAIYGASGSIPYIVDSGAPVVPQLMGSAPAVPIAYSQAQFIMGMSNASAGLNGSGPSRPNFDLNFGLAIEGGNTESMGLRHPFMPAQGRSIEEHFRANTQASSSSGVAMKRKEPEGGWDPYTFNYRQQQFPWKQ